MSDATYYNWKAKYSGVTASDLKQLKALEAENRRFKADCRGTGPLLFV
jgi:putative transposase